MIYIWCPQPSSQGVPDALCPGCVRPHRADEIHSMWTTSATTSWPGAIRMGDHANDVGCEHWALGFRRFCWSVWLFAGVHQIEDPWWMVCHHPQTDFIKVWASIVGFCWQDIKYWQCLWFFWRKYPMDIRIFVESFGDLWKFCFFWEKKEGFVKQTPGLWNNTSGL